MENKNRAKKGVSAVGAFAVLFLGAIAVFMAANYFGWSLPGAAGGPLTPGDSEACGSTNLISFVPNVYNGLNTSDGGGENIDVSYVITGDGGYSTTATDTTAPTAITLPCGQTYTMKFLSSSGAAGDHSVVTNIRAGAGARIVNGDIVFTAASSAMALDVDIAQHGVLETKVWDRAANAWMYMSQDTSSGNYTVRGVGIGSTTQNYTSGGATAVGSGGKLELTQYLRVNSAQDQQFNDRGFYIFVDESTTVWDVPTAIVNGATKSSNCGVMTDEEALQFNGEDYCYKFNMNDVAVTNNVPLEIAWTFNARSGQNPGSTNTINVTACAIGAYASATNTKLVEVGAAKDDSSSTQVFSCEEWLVAVS